MTNKISLIKEFFIQQKELDMPDIICSPTFDIDFFYENILKKKLSYTTTKTLQNKVADAKLIKEDYSNLIPVSRLMTIQKDNYSSIEQKKLIQEDDDTKKELINLFKSTRNCTNCHLHKLRTKFVFGSGNACAKIMIIGEAPGHDEDISGLPFVGAAGNLLTKMLSAINLDRKKDVFITNILKCRPPENRQPESLEIVSCLPILKKQIEIIKPQIFLLLGRIAAHTMLDTKEGISSLRQKVHYINNIPAHVTYHPSSLLRNPSNKKYAWEDLQKFKQALKEIKGIYAE